MGLCLGFSLVSIVECIYWLIYKMMLTLSSRKKHSKQTSPPQPVVLYPDEDLGESTNQAIIPKRKGMKFYSIEISHPVYEPNIGVFSK